MNTHTNTHTHTHRLMNTQMHTQKKKYMNTRKLTEHAGLYSRLEGYEVLLVLIVHLACYDVCDIHYY